MTLLNRRTRIACLVALATLFCAPASAAAPTPVYRWTTLTGRASMGSEDGPVADARFNSPAGLAQDLAGNLYVADYRNHTVRKISPAGIVSTIAGKAGEPGNADGIGAEARFTLPWGLSADIVGNVYVYESGRGVIRQITPAGVVSTIKGPDGSPLNVSEGAIVGPDGTVYFWQSGLLKKLAAGQVQTIALPATAIDSYGRTVTLTQVWGPAIDATGQLYFLTQLGVVKLNPEGTVTLIPNTHQGTYNGAVFNDCAGNLYQLLNYSGYAGLPGFLQYVQLGTNEGITFDLATDSHPLGFTIGPRGAFFTLYDDDVVTSGPQTVYAGTVRSGAAVDGSASTARFHNAQHLAVDDSGAVWITESTAKGFLVGDYYRVTVPSLRKLSPEGLVTTVVAPDYTALSGLYEYASRYSVGLAPDGAGGVYFAQSRSAPINQTKELHAISAAGADRFITYLPEDTGSFQLDASGRRLVRAGNDIRRQAPDGTWEIIAHGTTDPDIKDGPKDVARFCGLGAFATDGLGNTIVLDLVAYDNVTFTTSFYIRRIAPDGRVKTIGPKRQAGNGKFPTDIAADRKGRIYFCYSDRITLFDEEGTEATIGGRDGAAGIADGMGELARFSTADYLVTDTNDNLYLTDAYGTTVRKGTFAGIAPTITAQPQSVTATAGGTVQFSVTASSTPAPAYQWYFNGNAFSGATGSALSLSNARSADAGDYYVVIMNSLGSVTSEKATLTVNAAPATHGDGGSAGGGALEAWFVAALLAVTAKKFGRRGA